MSSARRRLAGLVTRPLPPLVAPRVGTLIYPPSRARADDVEAEGRARTGARYRCRTGHVLGGLGMLLYGYYEWRTVVIAAGVCGPGDTVVEVGAHIGSETVSLADLVGPTGRVHAFEPLDRNADLLQTNLDLNGFGHVTVHRVAVDDQAGTVAFTAPRGIANTAAGHLGAAVAEDGAEVLTVPVVRLDDALGSDANVRLLTVDAEGADTGVLVGGRELIARDRPVLIVEALPPHSNRYGRWTLDDLADEIRGHDYALWRVGRLGLAPIPPSARGDAELSPREAPHLNWLALPHDEVDRAGAIHRALRRAAFAPCVGRLNPLAA